MDYEKFQALEEILGSKQDEDTLILFDSCVIQQNNFCYRNYKIGNWSEFDIQDLEDLSNELFGTLDVLFSVNSKTNEGVKQELQKLLEILSEKATNCNGRLKRSKKYKHDISQRAQTNKQKFEYILEVFNQYIKQIKIFHIKEKKPEYNLLNNILRKSFDIITKNKKIKSNYVNKMRGINSLDIKTDEDLVATTLHNSLVLDKKTILISKDTDLVKLLFYFYISLDYFKKQNPFFEEKIDKMKDRTKNIYLYEKNNFLLNVIEGDDTGLGGNFYRIPLKFENNFYKQIEQQFKTNLPKLNELKQDLEKNLTSLLYIF